MPIGRQTPGHCTISWTKLWLSLVEERSYDQEINALLFSSGRRTHLFPVRSISVSMTSGLVQDIEHQVLPAITPSMTFILTLVFMIVMKNSSFDLIYFGLFSQV